MDLFISVMNELSLLIDAPLTVESRRICGLKINDTLHLQLKEEGNQILISTLLGEMPIGKARENCLKWALKDNREECGGGILCYVPRKDQLALFLFVTLETLSGALLADILDLFLQKALRWKEAVLTGQQPLETSFLAKGAPSLFDLAP
ncbi:MAG: CesT family type III secretion system chaperone [Candidatus Rhabdochlamydia sp.]